MSRQIRILETLCQQQQVQTSGQVFADRVLQPTGARPLVDSEGRKSLSICIQPLVLLLVFSAYVLFGAMVFKALEGPHSIASQWKLRRDLTELVENTCLNYTIVADILDTLDSDESRLASHVLFKNETRPVWTLLGSTKIVLTIITTIGYGNIVVQTSAGRLFCIFYASIGIPLTITMLHKLGELIFHIAEVIFAKFCSKALGEKKLLQTFVMQLIWATLIWLAPGGLYVLFHDWSYVDAIYFIFITQSTIGLGDVVLNEEGSTALGVLALLHIIVGMAWVSLIITRIANLIQSNADSLEDSMLEMEVQRLQRELLTTQWAKSQMREAVRVLSSKRKKSKAPSLAAEPDWMHENVDLGSFATVL